MAATPEYIGSKTHQYIGSKLDEERAARADRGVGPQGSSPTRSDTTTELDSPGTPSDSSNCEGRTSSPHRKLPPMTTLHVFGSDERISSKADVLDKSHFIIPLSPGAKYQHGKKLRQTVRMLQELVSPGRTIHILPMVGVATAAREFYKPHEQAVLEASEEYEKWMTPDESETERAYDPDKHILDELLCRAYGVGDDTPLVYEDPREVIKHPLFLQFFEQVKYCYELGSRGIAASESKDENLERYAKTLDDSATQYMRSHISSRKRPFVIDEARALELCREHVMRELAITFYLKKKIWDEDKKKISIMYPVTEGGVLCQNLNRCIPILEAASGIIALTGKDVPPVTLFDIRFPKSSAVANARDDSQRGVISSGPAEKRPSSASAAAAGAVKQGLFAGRRKGSPILPPVAAPAVTTPAASFAGAVPPMDLGMRLMGDFMQRLAQRVPDDAAKWGAMQAFVGVMQQAQQPQQQPDPLQHTVPRITPGMVLGAQ